MANSVMHWFFQGGPHEEGHHRTVPSGTTLAPRLDSTGDRRLAANASIDHPALVVAMIGDRGSGQRLHITRSTVYRVAARFRKWGVESLSQ